MADLFWSYWDASVRFGLLALVLLTAVPLLRRWISPKLLCWAWALLILRLALPFALPFSGSIFNLSEKLQPSTWSEALRSGVVEAGLGETILPRIHDRDADLALEIGFSWEHLLLAIWISGILVLLAGLVVNAFRLRRFFARAQRHSDGRLYELFKETRRRYRIHSNVPLLVSRDIKTPGIAGIFNPRVVLPELCARELNDSELRCVLLHELTHYRRGDLFIHHFLLVICFLHWYNPLVWMALRQFKISMEQACDGDVIESDCIETAQQYGFTLLQVMQRSRLAFASPAGALCLLGNRTASAMKERIRLIASPRRQHPAFMALGLSLFGLSFVYALTGEEVVEREAERLLSLTRLSGPMLFMAQAAQSQSAGSSAIAWGPSESALPQAWVQDMDVSDLVGQSYLFRLSYRLNAASDSQAFWLSVKNDMGQVLISEGARNGKGEAGAALVFEVPITLPAASSEMVYGLSTNGSAGVRVESLDLLPVRSRTRAEL